MGQVFDSIDADREAFIRRQHLFIVATAPGQGRVNCSPRGMDCLRILGPNRVAFLDITGSGNETAAHVRDNGRMTLMFMSFDAAPGIVRLYGRARLVLPVDPEWDALLPLFTALPAMRQIFVLDVDRVSTACGYGVPKYQYECERDIFPKWKVGQEPGRLRAWWAEYNLASIDGLPTGLDRVLEPAPLHEEAPR
ncbi:pyridoxamine 5'-phosphate oxidase family protein [Leptolyngbya sp. 15MV]|nr:pyridoxamine 5'-phosphate oxidase family protein [Leptolyngbya sp. 15MV]